MVSNEEHKILGKCRKILSSKGCLQNSIRVYFDVDLYDEKSLEVQVKETG